MFSIGIFPILLVAFLFTGIHADRDKGSLFDQILAANTAAEKEAAATTFAGGKSNFPNLVEGDILKNDKDETEDAFLFNAQVNGKWPNAVVYYTFYDNEAAKLLYNVVWAAADEFRNKTCIQWIYESASVIKKRSHYVIFFNTPGCYSKIGMRTKKGGQKLSLGEGCREKATAMHEMMHAMGFWHEQSRLDRDDFIRIIWENIEKGMSSNFEKYLRGNTLNEPYDKKSLMHYGGYAFSKNRKRTIESRSDVNEELGQRIGFTQVDINKLNKHYCTVKGTVSSCLDAKEYVTSCPSWARYGYCISQLYGPWMKKYCKKSCRVCS